MTQIGWGAMPDKGIHKDKTLPITGNSLVCRASIYNISVLQVGLNVLTVIYNLLFLHFKWPSLSLNSDSVL